MKVKNEDISIRAKKTNKEILELCKKASENTLIETLDIEFEEVGKDYVVASMPVTPKIHQPDGVMHGGASAALAETVGSMAAYIFHNGKDYFIRGIEISVNHLKSIREGRVFARAEFLHLGRTTQLVDIKITDEKGQLISSSKLTCISLPKKESKT